ncbi:glycolate oxidase subunit GlcE [Roseovarius rhodophyticola]|uniref:Glycolate oxidase subunit GlcE n=1 Tax=Roseovarius rhodophyticola TaxID=3080827 RepID=A0ABZ2TJJ5_9RHOB|nr:glycolate oxidase subunit GlcE [Roseovarius sp. W115]MDV2930247.1 glycolate oxidase subunit GlcE [Roseovarius sp. W115]
MKPLSPSSEAELAELVSSTSEPLRVMGGGTRPIGVPVNAQPLTTQKISGIALYEPGALTLVAKAGTTVAEIEKALAKENQRLAFEPMDHRGLLGTKGEPTIGGVFAANVSGPRRIQCGAARDFLLGVRFVDGQGQITRNGGRVMKNVTGYDIVKLMAGSYGTLGVLTEVALKVLPRSNVTGTLKLAGLTDVQAISALSAALGSPYEVTGAAHLPKGNDSTPQTFIRIEGFENSVKYRSGELFKMLGHLGEVKFELDQQANATLWQNIRDVDAFHGRDGDVWRLSVKPSDAPDIVAQVGPEDVVYDWGGGLIWLLMPQDTGAEVIRSAVADKGGHATLIRGNRAAGAFQPLSAPVAALQNGLRARFDPKGVLNPGLMGQAA